MSRHGQNSLRILVTGGPTRAYLDDVRYLSNLSTGEVAFHVCRELRRRKVEVFAIVGPTSFAFEKLGLKLLRRVETNEEMRRAVLSVARGHKVQAAILSAAVLDFVPAQRKSGKVSSKIKRWDLRLRPAPKIIDQLHARHPTLFRFAFKLEPRRLTRKSKEQFIDRIFREKKIDGLCLNFLSEIADKRHTAELIAKDGRSEIRKSKEAIAKWIADYVVAQLSRGEE